MSTVNYSYAANRVLQFNNINIDSSSNNKIKLGAIESSGFYKFIIVSSASNSTITTEIEIMNGQIIRFLSVKNDDTTNKYYINLSSNYLYVFGLGTINKLSVEYYGRFDYDVSLDDVISDNNNIKYFFNTVYYGNDVGLNTILETGNLKCRSITTTSLTTGSIKIGGWVINGHNNTVNIQIDSSNTQ